MDYEEFKKLFLSRFKDYLPPVYCEWVLEIAEMPKVNAYREAVTMRPEKGSGCSPVIYLDELYDYYHICRDFDCVGQKAAASFVLGMEHISGLNPPQPFEMPKDSIIFELVSQKGNERLLENVPHRITMDIALLYRVFLEADCGGFNSAMITYEIAREMGLDEDELFQLAMENTPRLLPLDVMEYEAGIVIITNELKTLGAAAMLYPGALQKIAEKTGYNLFILPASVHEVFAVPDVGQDVDEMNRIIQEANKTVIGKEEFLSQHAYYYRRDCDKVFDPSNYCEGDVGI